MSSRIPSYFPVKPIETSVATSSPTKAPSCFFNKIIFGQEEIILSDFNSVPEIKNNVRLIGQKFIEAFPPQDFQQFFLQYRTCSIFWQKFLLSPSMNPEKIYTFLWHFMQEYSPYEHKFSAAFLEQFLAQDDQHLFTDELGTFDRLLIRAFWGSNWPTVIDLVLLIKTTKPLSIYYKNMWLFSEIRLWLNSKRDKPSLESISAAIGQFESFKAIEPTETDTNLLTRMIHAFLYQDVRIKEIVAEFNQKDVKTLKCAITLAAISLMIGSRLLTFPKSICLYHYLLFNAQRDFLNQIGYQQQTTKAATLPANSELNAGSSKQTQIIDKSYS